MSITGSCPKVGSGKFYVCQGNTTQFIGCCTIDPCADGSGNCPSEQLGYTSFDADSYDSIPPEACVSSGDWWTCKGTTTAFMGCCLTNPCLNDGCYGGNLTAAKLSSNTTEAAPFMTSTTSDAPDKPSLSTGGKVGIAIGCVLGAVILGVAFFMLYKRRQKREVANPQQVDGQTQHEDGQPQHDGKLGMYMPSPYQGKLVILLLTYALPSAGSAQSMVSYWSNHITDSTGFPTPPSQYAEGFGPSPASGYPSPELQYQQQRPVSVAPSWLSGSTAGYGYGHGTHPSISSIGSSQGGLHSLYNQQRTTHQLNTVSEMDSTPVVRELPGSTFTDEHQPHEIGYSTRNDTEGPR